MSPLPPGEGQGEGDWKRLLSPASGEGPGVRAVIARVPKSPLTAHSPMPLVLPLVFQGCLTADTRPCGGPCAGRAQSTGHRGFRTPRDSRQFGFARDCRIPPSSPRPLGEDSEQASPPRRRCDVAGRRAVCVAVGPPMA